MLPDASGMEAWRDWHRCAGLVFSPLKKSVHLPDANTRLQAVISGHGIALLDELAQPEIEAGQMVRVSEIALQEFGCYMVLGLKHPLFPAASNFQNWLKSQVFP